MTAQIDKVLEKLDNIQNDITDLKIENAKQTQCIKINTKDLTDHKEGVIQNRIRIEKIEMVWKVLLGLGTSVGIIFTILKVVEYFK